MKKISVIIPVYNVEKYLAQCLDSVLSQTYGNLEIICVNDGSTDNSGEILKQYAEKDPRIKVVTQPNGGLSCARNTGIDAASGEYIVFLDSDDWMDSQACECALEALEKNSADVCMWGYVREFNGNSLEKKIFDSDKIFDENASRFELHRRIVGLLDEELADPSNADSIVTAWGKLYRADIIIDNKLYYVDNKIIGTEDALFNLYYFGFVKKIVFIDKPFNHYRRDNGGSITSNNNPKLFEQWNVLFDKMSDYITENNCPEEFETALNNRICLSIIGLGFNELSANVSSGQHIKNIKKILDSERYKRAYGFLETKYFPIHWKLFFIMCKKGFAPGVYALLKAMRMMTGK